MHLEHIGNCFPFQKNDLSGFWWQKLKCRFAPLIFMSLILLIDYLLPKAKITVKTKPAITPKIAIPQT